MRRKPLFSIVIVNYNHGEFLEETILSILSQNCDDYELLIVDGGSNDNSVSIIKRYSDQLAWWISERDNGQSEAFNKGFARARGEYFFWVNADDLLLPNALKIAKRLILKNSEAVWWVANTVFFNRNGEVLKCSRGLKWYNFLIKSAPIYVYGPTSIFHRSIFEEVGGFDESLHYTMDTDLWMRYYRKQHRFIRIPKYFWGFRIHNNSKTSESLRDNTAPEHRLEQEIIAKKNNHGYSKKGRQKQKIFKLFSGTYLMSYIDTCRYKGMTLSKLKLN